MFDSNPTLEKAVDLVDHGGRLISTPRKLHALDDPSVWRAEPAYTAPADVDIVQTQKWIDSLMGTTKGNESIYKLVWNGDPNYWYEFFYKWNSTGKPTTAPAKRPRVRYKFDPKTLRDVFPPRWLLLTRIEPEQYADSWKRESWVWAPEINCEKQIRPDTPPPVFWAHFATVAEHGDFCCASAEKRQELCFGKYCSPRAFRERLENQKAADIAAGNLTPFEKIDGSFISEIEDENNGYKQEMAKLRAEAEIMIENPMALLGVEGSLRAGINDPKEARRIVSEYYDRQAQERAKLI